jgi:hypothetical protein
MLVSGIHEEFSFGRAMTEIGSIVIQGNFFFFLTAHLYLLAFFYLSERQGDNFHVFVFFVN